MKYFNFIWHLLCNMCKNSQAHQLPHAKENTMADSSSFEALNPYQMCDKAAAVMEGKALKPARKSFLLVIMAGVFIGLGFLYCAFANAICVC